MTLTEFAGLAARLRAAQRTYFQTRTPRDLALAKKLEREFDLAVEEVLRLPGPRQEVLRLPGPPEADQDA